MPFKTNPFFRSAKPAATVTSDKSDCKPSPLDTVFDVSSLVLTTLTDFAQWAPVPYLQQASSLALAILTTVQVGSLFFVLPLLTR